MARPSGPPGVSGHRRLRARLDGVANWLIQRARRRHLRTKSLTYDLVRNTFS